MFVLVLSFLAAACNAGDERGTGTPVSDAGPATGQPIDSTGITDTAGDATERDSGDADVAGGGRIPSRYVGRWGASAEACARSTHEMRLTISVDRMEFYEGSGAVVSVESSSGGDRVLLDMQAEGTSFQRTYTLTLDAAGDRLTVTTEGSSAVRVRCSG